MPENYKGLIIMLDAIGTYVSDHYIWFKCLHMVFAMIWVWSTSVAYTSYLVPAFRRWVRDPQNPDNIQMRNWVMERFDSGVILEHIAFPVLLLTGPLLMLAGGWSPEDGWLAAKLVLVVLLFIPIELFDYYLSHFGGNKEMLRKAGKADAYEVSIHRHWWFLIVTTPIISIFAIGTLIIAITKPF